MKALVVGVRTRLSLSVRVRRFAAMCRNSMLIEPVIPALVVEIPPKIHDIILDRTNILREEERDILDCASVVGEEFSSDMIEKITGLNRLRLLKKLSRIERKYQLIHSFDGKYRFDHAKIREVIYQEMAPELR